VHDPPVVILDEPTAGVDVELRRQLWRYMKELNARGTTVVLTTHYLEEAEELCDRIAIIDRGRVVAADRKDALLRRIDEKELWLRVQPAPAVLPPALTTLGFELVGAGELRIRYPARRTRVGGLLDAVRAAGLEVVDLRTREPDLEEIFLRLVARDPALRGEAAP